MSSDTETLDESTDSMSQVEGCTRSILAVTVSSPLTSSAGDSHVRTSVLPETALDLTENAAASGLRWFDSFASYAPDSSSWRTSQVCWIEGWALFSETWPRVGMTLNGRAFQLDDQWATTEPECLLWPTLCARDYRSGATPTRSALMRRVSSRGNDLPASLRVSIPDKSGLIDPYWAEEYMGFPVGWTELNRSVTASSRKSRSASSSVSRTRKPK